VYGRGAHDETTQYGEERRVKKKRTEKNENKKGRATNYQMTAS